MNRAELIRLNDVAKRAAYLLTITDNPDIGVIIYKNGAYLIGQTSDITENTKDVIAMFPNFALEHDYLDYPDYSYILASLRYQIDKFIYPNTDVDFETYIEYYDWQVIPEYSETIAIYGNEAKFVLEYLAEHSKLDIDLPNFMQEIDKICITEDAITDQDGNQLSKIDKYCQKDILAFLIEEQIQHNVTYYEL